MSIYDFAYILGFVQGTLIFFLPLVVLLVLAARNVARFAFGNPR